MKKLLCLALLLSGCAAADAGTATTPVTATIHVTLPDAATAGNGPVTVTQTVTITPTSTATQSPTNTTSTTASVPAGLVK